MKSPPAPGKVAQLPTVPELKRVLEVVSGSCVNHCTIRLEVGGPWFAVSRARPELPYRVWKLI